MDWYHIHHLDGLLWDLGSYFANKAITTTTDFYGYTGGFTLHIIQNKLLCQGDYFSGHNNLSGAVINVIFYFIPSSNVYFGIGIPESNSGNEFYDNMGISHSFK